ncbi:hypothetical protein [Kiloniella majae]|uniref:hypothetical protein n=1 Tax=Kiloniella majae TaxID=1938558 RepID=UPI000A277E30|nr:hypothetical protein [Kiloniella majae]
MKKTNFSLILVFASLIFVMISRAYADANPVSLLKEKLATSVSNKRVLMVKNGEKISKFRIVDLEKLPLYEVSLPPIWENEAGKYQGVLLSDIFKTTGIADIRQVKMVALGGYAIDLTPAKWPVSCLFVATRYQSREIRVERKGPIRLLLPCMIKEKDGETNYREISTVNWIWNLKEIHILN